MPGKPPKSTFNIEADVVPGLEPFAREEISSRLGKFVPHLVGASEGALTFPYSGDLRELLKLRSVVAIYIVNTYPVPRPKALLGHQYFESIIATSEAVMKLHPAGTFATLRLSAAGEESAVMSRLRDELADRLGLKPASDEGDLLLRLRPAGPRANVPLPNPFQPSGRGYKNPLSQAGREMDEQRFAATDSNLKPQTSALAWEVLTRISPRPLVTRAWRVSNMPGALNATVAYAMVKLTRPGPDDMFLNLACGSGGLLIERLATVRARLAIGCDIDRSTLNHAAANLAAFTYGGNAILGEWDATALPLKSHTVNALVADLPFGALIGSHTDNERLYPALLNEAARVAQPGAYFIALSHELKLMQRLLEEHSKQWRLAQSIRVRFGGLTPAIYVLRRQ
jgi:tRNA (guanine6-N2)-methyltransferase